MMLPLAIPDAPLVGLVPFLISQRAAVPLWGTPLFMLRTKQLIEGEGKRLLIVSG